LKRFIRVGLYCSSTPLPKEELLRQWRVLKIIAAARTEFDPEPIVRLLAPAAVYESQAVLEPLKGREAIAESLRKRFRYIEGLSGERDTGRLIPGIVDVPEARAHPCLIFEADARRQALWMMRLGEGGQIARFDILTVAPHPDEALATNFPAGPN
jgi:hypothetical protein